MPGGAPGASVCIGVGLGTTAAMVMSWFCVCAPAGVVWRLVGRLERGLTRAGLRARLDGSAPLRKRRVGDRMSAERAAKPPVSCTPQIGDPVLLGVGTPKDQRSREPVTYVHVANIRCRHVSYGGHPAPESDHIG